MDPEPKPRREIRIPLPDTAALKAGWEKAKEFERRPPKWAYWVGGFAIIVLVRIIHLALSS